MTSKTLGIGWMHSHVPAPGSERPYTPRKAPSWELDGALPGSAHDEQPESILGALGSSDGDDQ